MSDGEELIRDIWRRWNAGERRLDSEVMDPGIEVHSVLAGNVFQGEEGLLRWIGEIDDQFEAWELGLDEVRELRPESLIAHGSISARGRQSGLPLDQPASWLIGLRAGRLARIVNFIGPAAHDAAERAGREG